MSRAGRRAGITPVVTEHRRGQPSAIRDLTSDETVSTGRRPSALPIERPAIRPAIRPPLGCHLGQPVALGEPAHPAEEPDHGWQSRPSKAKERNSEVEVSREG